MSRHQLVFFLFSTLLSRTQNTLALAVSFFLYFLFFLLSQNDQVNVDSGTKSLVKMLGKYWLDRYLPTTGVRTRVVTIEQCRRGVLSLRKSQIFEK